MTRPGAIACVAVLATSLVAGACSASRNEVAVSIPTSTSVPESSGPLFGIAVPEGRADTVLLAAEELDVDFGLVRLFYRWDSAFPEPEINRLRQAGHEIHLSVRPRTDGGRTIPWVDLANAVEGDQIYDELVRWIDSVIALGPGVYFTINHEPETTDSADNGTADEYVDMWRRVTELVRERGGDDVPMVWTMTGGAFSDSRAEAWYPGDDVVDVVGADIYNWHTCQGTERSWDELTDLIGPALDFARTHGKPLAVPEFGSVEDTSADAPADRKSTWFRNAASTLTDESIIDDLEFVAYFNITAPGGTWPDCEWDYDTSPSAVEGFAELVNSLS